MGMSYLTDIFRHENISEKGLKDRHRLLFSAVLVTVLLAATWALIPITFETNDDESLMNYLSGAKTGKPEADTTLILFLWGKIVSSLYRITGAVPWYTLIFLALIALSLVTVCYCVVVSFPKWGGSLFCLLYFSMFLYYSVILQFTTVAAFCGVAAVSLLLIGREEETRKNIIIKNILIFSFMFCSVNIRMTVGYLVLGNAAFAICLEILRYLFKTADKRKIKNMIISFLALLAAAAISIAVNNIHESLGEWEEFREYNSERVNFIDYSKPDYEPNKDLFDKIGWSEEFYELVQRWFFMDENINTETLRQINERNVHGPIHVGRTLLHEWFPNTEFQVKAWVLLLIVLLVDAVRRREGRRRTMVSFLWLFVWFAETQYFGYTGRIMERALEAWTLLAVIPSILGTGGNCSVTEEGNRNRKENLILSGVALALCLMCACYPVGGYVRAKSFSLACSEAKIRWANIEDYAIAHQENVYIYGVPLSGGGSPFRVYTEGLPYNLIFWGGSFYNSPIYYAQIQKNGFEQIYMEDFFEENVYFIAGDTPDENLSHVMEEKFPGCTCEVTDEQDGFIVYKYSKNK